MQLLKSYGKREDAYEKEDISLEQFSVFIYGNLYK